MNDDGRTARQMFDDVMANPARARFGFGTRVAIVNVDLQNAYTRIDEFTDGLRDRPAPDRARQPHLRGSRAQRRCRWSGPMSPISRRRRRRGVGHAHRTRPTRLQNIKVRRPPPRLSTSACEIDRGGPRHSPSGCRRPSSRRRCQPAGLAQGRHGGRHRRLDLGLRPRDGGRQPARHGYRTIVPMESVPPTSTRATTSPTSPTCS